MEKISAIIITYNVEDTIDRCLQSVQKIASEIIVVDSFSTDNTISILKKYSVRVYTQKWLGYAKQKKFALKKTTNNWILWIDADEEISPKLIHEIKEVNFLHDGYWLPRKVFYLQKWIHHCGWYPDYVLRLFRKDKGTFNDEIIHEQVILKGSSLYLKQPLFHYSYKNITHHLEKMNTFTSLSAEKMFQQKRKSSFMIIIGHTLVHFMQKYLLKKGFLDGIAGLIICSLGAYQVFLKYAKLWELCRVRPTKL